jgi:hypothetical protein
LGKIVQFHIPHSTFHILNKTINGRAGSRCEKPPALRCDKEI